MIFKIKKDRTNARSALLIYHYTILFFNPHLIQGKRNKIGIFTDHLLG